MNCDQTTELLPWWLNGSLGEEERHRVRGHLDGCAACRQALSDTRQAWEIFAQHLPAEALVALAAGEEPAGFDRAVVADHLAACPECAAELELVRTSRGLTEDDAVALLAPRTRTAPARSRRTANAAATVALAAGLACILVAGGWYNSARHARSLAARLDAATPRPPAEPSPFPHPDDDRGRTAELQGQLEAMQKTVEELRASEARARQQLADAAVRPEVNTWVGSVRASGDVVRGETPEPDQIVPASAPAATLLLRAGENAQGDRDLEVVDAAGKVVLKAEGLHADPDSGDYSLTLHRGTLKPGDYTLRLYRHGTPAESYSVRVR
jgi:anti-sigma factor RsiW